MSVPTSPRLNASDRDLPTPRPTDQRKSDSLDSTQHSGDSGSPSPVDGMPASSGDGRKSFSSLSASSLSTSYSSADDLSEVGELLDNSAHPGGVHLEVDVHRSGSGDSVPVEKRTDQAQEGKVDRLEQQLEDLNVEHGREVGDGTDEGEDEESYLNDPLVKYTIQLHDYTKRLYIEARMIHEKLQRERSRGGKAGRSGIEAMGRKTAATRY